MCQHLHPHPWACTFVVTYHATHATPASCRTQSRARNRPHPSRPKQTLNAMERQDLEHALPHFQEVWSSFDPRGTGKLPAKHLFTVRNCWQHTRIVTLSCRKLPALNPTRLVLEGQKIGCDALSGWHAPTTKTSIENTLHLSSPCYSTRAWQRFLSTAC